MLLAASEALAKAVEAAVSAANSGRTASFDSHHSLEEFLVTPLSPNDRERHDRTISKKSVRYHEMTPPISHSALKDEEVSHAEMEGLAPDRAEHSG
jgi:hypothetical protein